MTGADASAYHWYPATPQEEARGDGALRPIAQTVFGSVAWQLRHLMGVRCVAFDWDGTAYRGDPPPNDAARVDWAWCREHVSWDFVELARALDACGIKLAVASYSDPAVISPEVLSGEAFVGAVLRQCFGRGTPASPERWTLLCRFTSDGKIWHLRELCRQSCPRLTESSLLLIDDVRENADTWTRCGARALHVDTAGQGFRIEPLVRWLESQVTLTPPVL